ncbi:hypothetical protein CTDIVETGP_1984 [Clostridium tyrobutyricum DIVETGP]|uniref:Uncharacterized protein n=1 Tax=Clostridium tyrobutyricum DIVETGP TaxID=1408889 RepID=W6N8W3_CLOTY|nr:hypothetical protein CTK_C20610 [Clostridium tyrobutyricum]CDL91914.1 hypothetical protein CTDIVETGP_1984 [Clostridium tyrobutyricum DIVETGP]
MLLVLDVFVVKEHDDKVRVIATIVPNFNMELIIISPHIFKDI